MNDVITEPAEQPEIQTAVLLSEDLEADRETGIESNQRTVDIPKSLEVGSMVEVPVANMEEQHACSDGTFNGERYFSCPPGKGFFTFLEQCRPHSRLLFDAQASSASYNFEEVSRGYDAYETSQRQLSEMDKQQVTRMEQELRERDRESRELEQQVNSIQRQLVEKESQEAILNEQVTRMEQELRERDRESRELEQQVNSIQRQLVEKESQEAILNEQVTRMEQELREKDLDLNESELNLAAVQETLSEVQNQQTPDWVISRHKVMQTYNVLGRGAWGQVVEGRYCGSVVAVKQIHQLILSAHNRSLF
ncbi:hypothetical protein ACROYT_G036268 [Oculina patagonica]